MMDLAKEATETIRELKKQGVTIQLLNWIVYIQNKAAEIYLKRCKDLDIFPALILDECMLEAAECFVKDKSSGLIDEYNCYKGN